MMQLHGNAESQIKAVIEAWADAVRRHDLSGILAHHERDIVMFDVPPPLQSRGIDEYKKTWDLFFRYHMPSQAFDIQLPPAKMSPSRSPSCGAAPARSTALPRKAGSFSG
jgi:ketosteroid isomerase-like protein